MLVADEPTAGREGGFDSGNGIVVRNSQIEMNSVALGAWTPGRPHLRG
jgi:hypothetical protein